MVEELKIVAEILKTIGAEGRTMFIWWLLLTKALGPLLLVITILTAVYIAAGTIIRCVRSVQCVQALGRAAGVDLGYELMLRDILAVERHYLGRSHGIEGT